MRKRFGINLAILMGSLALFAAAPVLACGFDGIPSVSGNGALAHLILQRGSVGTLSHWAPFVFPAPYSKDKPIKFSENLSELRKSLLPQAFGHPWRWNFGDGSSVANGLVVNHTYNRAGTYKVAVFAYYSSYKSWLEFDDVLVQVR